MKVCKRCGLEKELVEFYFHKTYSCYLGKCKDCTNLARRIPVELKKQKIKKQKIKKEKTLRVILPKKRACKICSIEKEINLENYYIDKTRFSKVCRECVKTFKKNNSEVIKDLSRKDKQLYDLFYRNREFDIKKGLAFSLSKEFIKHIMSLPCVYCGFPSTGLDRLDNNLGHTEENCVPCCRECNIARNNNFSPEEMKIIGEAIRKVKEKR